MANEQDKLKKVLEKYMKENAALLKKSKLASRVVIVFPENKKPSLISKFALWILKKNGGRFDTEFTVTK